MLIMNRLSQATYHQQNKKGGRLKRPISQGSRAFARGSSTPNMLSKFFRSSILS